MPRLFDLSKPEAQAIPSTFGGGWILPITDRAREFLAGWFEEAPSNIAPLGGVLGWIVEPYQAADLSEALRDAGIPWEVQQ